MQASGAWGWYTTKEQLDGLMEYLNPKGIRERALLVGMR